MNIIVAIITAFGGGFAALLGRHAAQWIIDRTKRRPPRPKPPRIKYRNDWLWRF